MVWLLRKLRILSSFLIITFFNPVILHSIFNRDFIIFFLAFFTSLSSIHCRFNLELFSAVFTDDDFLSFLFYFLLSALKAFSSDESFINSGSALTADGFASRIIRLTRIRLKLFESEILEWNNFVSISCKLRSFIIIVKLNIDDFAKSELFGFAIFRVSELFGSSTLMQLIRTGVSLEKWLLQRCGWVNFNAMLDVICISIYNVFIT